MSLFFMAFLTRFLFHVVENTRVKPFIYFIFFIFTSIISIIFFDLQSNQISEKDISPAKDLFCLYTVIIFVYIILVF